MKSFSEFLRKISRRLLLTPNRLKAIEALDPEHIYVENVRSILGLPTGLAKGLCELAVKRGILERRIEVLCPDWVVAAEAPNEELLPAEVTCWKEVNGNYEETLYPTAHLQKMEFYVFKPEVAA